MQTLDFKALDEHIGSLGEPQWTKYLDLGTNVVRLINYSKEFTPHVQKQLTYALRDSMPHYDATLIIWKGANLGEFTATIDKSISPMRWRLDRILAKKAGCPDPTQQIFQQYNPNTNTYYYAAENLEPEEFIKEGHIFVHTFNKITKTPATGIVHGAVVGLDNKGILFCARGQRGKSTLAVLAMMQGFEYVSDDYLILSKDETGLYADPIYSIITLSPRMYNELYYDLKGKFVSNNARKDKYVVNIEGYHDTFRQHYPISVCMFPEIVDDPVPSIVPCTKGDKGRAIVQLAHSTVQQTGDRHDMQTIKKIMDFTDGFEFYRINLCPDINANVECLRKFIKEYNCKKEKKDELCVK